MNVLLIGGGGREDALAWALARSPRLTRLDCAPGNAGTGRRGHNVDVAVDDLDGLVELARERRYDLAVVGPEVPLVLGLADRLRADGIAVFGPSAAAARLEGSKLFAKELMVRHDVPTAAFRTFDSADAAIRFLQSREAVYPLVLKADGLAAGKGVVIAGTPGEAAEVAGAMLSGRSFGAAGSTLLVEECLEGREVSFFVLADGERFVELATCQDYKRALDGDRGPNTGGMGAYSPSAYLDEATRHTILRRVVEPTLAGLSAEGSPYRGVLYVGLMLTAAGPRVLEFNARFGDPETQVLLPRLDGDWLDVLEGCARGQLGPPLRWRSESAVCVVMAAGGYPGNYEKGRLITGLDRAEAGGRALVFHAGTRRADDGRVVTAGGRVLGVTALGPDLASSRSTAYEAVESIRWEGEHHRGDIASDALFVAGGGSR